ncbi:MAG TPA: thioesterase family protein [Kofleriaceae bacterium]|nr:thioesterase family protein [Kofleriaceae bacterium]
MKPSLSAGLTHVLDYRVPDDKTVPHVFPESDLFRAMPRVFATAYMVGLIEWTCVEALRSHLDDGEQSVGTHIDVSHTAATPPGLTVRVEVRVESVEGRRIRFRVEARDDIEPIGAGTHERFVIDRGRFDAKVAAKAGPSGSRPA